MKKLTLTLLAAGLLFACNNNKEEKNETPMADTTRPKEVAEVPKGYDTIEVYHFKGKEPYINTDFIKNASEGEKALLGYYCYFFSTDCKDTKHCKLTEALGLGEQNSKLHKDLVMKWFNDEETMQLARDGDRISSPADKNKSWYEEIKLVKKGSDLIVVRYNSAWSTGNAEGKGRGTDEYQVEANHIKVIGRSHEDL